MVSWGPEKPVVLSCDGAGPPVDWSEHSAVRAHGGDARLGLWCRVAEGRLAQVGRCDPFVFLAGLWPSPCSGSLT